MTVADDTGNLVGKRTDYGFAIGAADVSLLCSDKKKGWVLLGVNTPKHRIQVYITRTGKVRVWDGNVELVKPAV